MLPENSPSLLLPLRSIYHKRDEEVTWRNPQTASIARSPAKRGAVPIDSIAQTGDNGLIVSFARFPIGLLFLSALLLTAAEGLCAEHDVPNNLDQQIAERTKQYQESLRQRAAQFSPSFQAKIESHVQQTVAKGLEKWKKGEIDIHVALPGWAATYRTAQFVARHLPFSGFPAGSFAVGNSLLNAVLTVTTVQYVLKVLTIPVVDSASVHSSFVGTFRQNRNVLSYFIRIVCILVQRC
jgi:hypothetical protein